MLLVSSLYVFVHLHPAPVVAQKSVFSYDVAERRSAALNLQLNKHPLWSLTSHSRGNHSCCRV